MRMFPPQSAMTDGLTLLARIEIVVILVHYQPSYNTSHTMKPSDPLLLADVLTPSHSQVPPSDHTVEEPSADAGV